MSTFRNTENPNRGGNKMEWERMGFDLSMLAYSILAIALLIAAGVAFVANTRRLIRRWEQEETGGATKTLIQTTVNIPPRT
jgi:hypothetical protein